jgi:hypothetical protein
MELTKLAGRIPTERNCCELLVLMEKEYDCCIKFWVDVRLQESGRYEIWLCAYGSGSIFDLLGDHYPVFRARVLSAQEGNLYPAMWSTLISMESSFRRVIPDANPPARP